MKKEKEYVKRIGATNSTKLKFCLEAYFSPYREHIVGLNKTFISPNGPMKIIYADWVSSGRLFFPIESKLIKHIGPFVTNTHTETCFTGSVMTHAYHEARTIMQMQIKIIY